MRIFKIGQVFDLIYRDFLRVRQKSPVNFGPLTSEI